MNTNNRTALLLNASNMAAFPVYPYAFIQVPALARREGVQLTCKDLLGIPEARWGQAVQSLIEQHDPAMILITLRNTDSLISGDYENEQGRRPYFPIERTRTLITAIRAVSDLRIAVGGFGFSILANELMVNLRPDLGVFGGPDPFFAHFGDLQAGHFREIPNLLYFQGDRLVSNPRVSTSPLADTEYTPQVIEEMMAFYDAFPSPGFQGAPVEIMRGCPHACRFCSEPHVAGKQVRYRDLDVVMADIEILADHGVTRIYMISSELNPERNEFVLQLSDRIRSFNERQAEDRIVTWFGANYLLKFSIAEYERLYASGFTGGWFDVTALDDGNARTMRTPYRNKTLLTHLKSYAQFERIRHEHLQSQGASRPVGLGNEDEEPGEKPSVTWSLFLGNPATTTETIRETLRVANQEGLAQRFQGCTITKNIRVFDYEEPDDATLAVAYSVSPELARTAYRQILPSFAYAPALLRHFGSEEEVVHMFDHVRETYLSTAYQRSRHWHSFVQQKTTLPSIARWMAHLSETMEFEAPSGIGPTSKGEASEVLRRLFVEAPTETDKDAREELALQVVDALLSACLGAFPSHFETMGLPKTSDELGRTTPYELAVAVFARWSTETELFQELTQQIGSVRSASMRDLIRFCVQAMLYRFNVAINPRYRDLFVAAS